jgi:transposase
MKNQAEIYVGVDVSQDSLDIMCLPTGKYFRVVNDSAGLSGLVKKLKRISPKRVLMEATGGYEAELRKRLYEANIPCIVANPYRVRLYARSMGVLAKTDKIDAKILAEYASNEKLHLDYRKTASEMKLSDLLTHRQQLLDLKSTVDNQNALISGLPLEQNMQILEFLGGKVERVDKEISDVISSDKQLSHDYEILSSIPGVGKVIAATILGFLPEIKLLDRKQLSSLVGVAPFNNDSGKHKGKRTTYGGRGKVRTAMYMGALVAMRYNPVIKVFYERLVLRGKPKKVALVACIRKLVEIMRALLVKGEMWKCNAEAEVSAEAPKTLTELTLKKVSQLVGMVERSAKVQQQDRYFSKEKKRKHKGVYRK